jgi:hypothetical protein
MHHDTFTASLFTGPQASARAKWHSRGEERVVSPGCVQLMMPGETHRTTAVSEPASFFVLWWTPEAMRSAASELGVSEAVHFIHPQVELAPVSGAMRRLHDAVNAGDLHTPTAAHKQLEPLVRAVMTHVPGTVAAKYILHGLGRIGSPRVRLPLVGPEDAEAALIEDEIALVGTIPGVDLSNFRPDRNAAAGGALPKVAGTTR